MQGVVKVSDRNSSLKWFWKAVLCKMYGLWGKKRCENTHFIHILLSLYHRFHSWAQARFMNLQWWTTTTITNRITIRDTITRAMILMAVIRSSPSRNRSRGLRLWLLFWLSFSEPCLCFTLHRPNRWRLSMKRPAIHWQHVWRRCWPITIHCVRKMIRWLNIWRLNVSKRTLCLRPWRTSVIWLVKRSRIMKNGSATCVP